MQKLVFRDCDCQPTVKLVGDVAPEYFSNEKQAVARFIDRCRMNAMFFAIHFAGKHILTVTTDDTVYGGFALVRRLK